MIHQAPTVDEADYQLSKFADKWTSAYPIVVKSWQQNWARVTPMFSLAPEIRKAIYTTNTTESLSITIRKIIKNRAVFPLDEAVRQAFLPLAGATGIASAREKGKLYGRPQSAAKKKDEVKQLFKSGKGLNKSGTYSDALPTFTYRITGFINNDTASVVSGAPAITTTANLVNGKITSGAGDYQITPTLGTLAAANYSFSFAHGTLAVGKEAAQTDYTGSSYVITAGPTVGTASAVRLAAHLTQQPDGAAGDIALAKARFELYKFNNTTTTPNYVFGNLAVSSSGDVETTVSLAVDDAYTVRVIVESANLYWTAKPVYEGTLTVAYGSAEKRVRAAAGLPPQAAPTAKATLALSLTTETTVR